MFDDCDIIHAYTTDDALTDGVLVDFSKLHSAEVRDAGIRWRVLMTATAYALAVELTDTAYDYGCDLKGRAWDVVWMLRWRVLREAQRDDRADTFFFDVAVVRDLPEPDIIRLKVVLGGDGTGQPAFFVMLPHED